MRDLSLRREAGSPYGTPGILRLGPLWWYTLEEPWRGNERSKSCIPTGTYLIKPVTHNISTPDLTDDYEAYEVTGVKDRTAIHIHIGNTVQDIEGCIVLGKDYRIIQAPRTGDMLPAVTNSKKAFDEFMAAMNGEEGMLDIQNACPDDVQLDWRAADA